MNKMFLAALLAISGGSIAIADTLLGHVADSEGNPVEFATVVALSANHEQGGAVTDSIGNYRIELPKGQYIVTFTLVGYDNAEKAVTVSGETRLDVTMTTHAVALHGVEVKASAIRRLPDRFVVRVEDMPAAIGKDGKELLQAAPGVWIDDKKIAINGKSGEALKDAIHKIIRNHTVLSYNSMWSYFPSTDAIPGTNRVWDMYSNNAYYYAGNGRADDYVRSTPPELRLRFIG